MNHRYVVSAAKANTRARPTSWANSSGMPSGVEILAELLEVLAAHAGGCVPGERAQGRAARILKRSCHITVVVATPDAVVKEGAR